MILANLLFLASTWSQAAVPDRSLHVLTTGNGHGFQIYDSNAHALTVFQDYPYRFVTRNMNDPSDDGPERRNLIGHLSFGAITAQGRVLSARSSASKGQGPFYVEQSQVISEEFENGLSQTMYAPFGYERNAMIATAAARASKSMFVDVRANLGERGVASKSRSRQIRKLSPGVFAETGSGAGVLIYVTSKSAKAACLSRRGAISIERSRTCPTLRLSAPGEKLTVGIQFIESGKEVTKSVRELSAFIGDGDPVRLTAAAIREMEDWRKTPYAVFKSQAERELWRQSEAVLRMAQIREPNRPGRQGDGLILASLPPGEWSIAWVRDMVYAIVGLVRAGHYPEAKLALNGMLNASPVGFYRSYVNDADYRISVTRYSGDGAEQGDYSGEDSPNVELDGWGLYLWAARQYVDFSGDVAWLDEPTREGTVYEALERGVVRPIESNLEMRPDGTQIVKADASVWEAHMRNAKHFAFTTMAAARGLCDFASMARKAGRDGDGRRAGEAAARVRAGFNRAFVHDGGVWGALERSPQQDVDASTVEALDWNLFDDEASADRMLASLEVLKTSLGGYRRNLGASDYEAHEFLWVDFKMASAFFARGEAARASELLDRTVRVSHANFGLIAENYNTVPDDRPLGSYVYSFPMVGYGPGVFFSAILDRDQRRKESRSCGEW